MSKGKVKLLPNVLEFYQDMDQKTLEKEISKAVKQEDYSKIKLLTELLEKRKKSTIKVVSKHTSFRQNVDNFLNDVIEKIDKDTYDQNNPDYDILKKMQNDLDQKKQTTQTQTLQKEIKDLEKAIDLEKEKLKNKAYKVFFQNDVKNYTKNSDKDIKALANAKQKEEERLKAQYMGVVTEDIGRKEFLSPSRRKLSSIRSKIENLRKDEDHYPKNVLIFLMALAKTNFFGIKQKTKRVWIKLTRKRKTDNIKENLTILEDMIKIDQNDSHHRIGMKNLIAEELHNAKIAYVEKQQKSIGLVA